MGKTVITEEMCVCAYEAAKEYWQGKCTLLKAKEKVGHICGMNVETAQIHISNICSMLRGSRYTHTMSESATRYYLDRIYEDFGKSVLEDALCAVNGHVEYFEKKSSRQRAIEALLKEYNAKVAQRRLS